MNFSVHLPNQLLEALDQHVKEAGESRSFVVREAVQQYLDKFHANQWPQSMLDHMEIGLTSSHKNGRSNTTGEPDYDSIRHDMNASMNTRVAEVSPKLKKRRA